MDGLGDDDLLAEGDGVILGDDDLEADGDALALELIPTDPLAEAL